MNTDQPSMDWHTSATEAVRECARLVCDGCMARLPLLDIEGQSIVHDYERGRGRGRCTAEPIIRRFPEAFDLF